METELERMAIRLMGDATSYQKMLVDSQRMTDTTMRQISQSSQQVAASSSAIGRFSQSVAGYAGGILSVMGLGGAFNIAKQAFSLANEAEENEVAFGTMLQNAEAGKKMVRDIQAFAAATPMDTSTLQSAAKTLLQFGTEGRNIMPILQMLGDATGGNAERMRAMALAFGQMSSAGRLMGQDLLQMINAGFNPLKEISRTTGTSMLELKNLMEKGGISTEMVTRAFQTATAAGGSFAGMMEKQSQTTSGLISTMKDDISASLRFIGKELIEGVNLKGMIRDVSAVAQGFMNWFSSLSAGTRTAIFTIIGVTIAVGLLTAGVILLGKAITFATGGLSVIGALLGMVFVGAVAGASAAAISLGGIGAAFAYIKTQALAFWEFIRPIRRAIVDLAVAVWDVLVVAWEGFKETVVNVWQSLAGDASVNWTKVRDTIRDAILFAEFSIKNFGTVASYVWEYAKLKFTQFALDIEHFFTTTVPELAGWFSRNWFSVMTDLANMQKTVLGNMLSNSINIMSNMKSLIAGTVTFDELWTPLTEGFKSSIEEIPKFSKRVMGEYEQGLVNDVAKLGDKLGKGFNNFKNVRMASWAAEDAAAAALGAAPATVEKQALQLGKTAGAAMKKGAQHEVKQFEAAVYGSAEALSRVSDFYERMNAARTNPSAGPEGAAGGMANKILEAQKAAIPGVDGNPVAKVELAGAGMGDTGKEAEAAKTSAGYLKEIRDTLRNPKGKVLEL